MSDYEAKAAMQMANTAIDATSRILTAFIEATSDRINDPESGNILKTFKKHVEEGGKLFSIPVSRENTQEFETYLNTAGIMAYQTEIVREKGTMQYLFRDKDVSAMEEVILAMRKSGKEILKSSHRDYGDLSDYSDGFLHAAVFKNLDQALRLTLMLDSYQVPYTKTVYPDRTEIAVASKDHEMLLDIAEYEPFARAMKSTNHKTSIGEARETVGRKKEEARAAMKKGNEKAKSHTRKEEKKNDI